MPLDDNGNYLSPYPLPTGYPQIPDGEFLLPVCTNRDRATKLVNALNGYRNLADEKDLDFQIDVMRAFRFVENPSEAACVPCSDPEAQCIAYYPTRSDKFEFSPGQINGTPPPPAGYIQHPFFTGDRYIVPGFNLLSTDVLCDAESTRPASLIGFVEQITSSGFPRVRFSWSGAATIELHMIAPPLGGMAIVRIDDGNEVNFYDINGVAPADIAPTMDFILSLIESGLEGAFVPIQIQEIEVIEPGDHYVDILFIPELELSITPIRWGGGIRKIVVCGRDVDCENQECGGDCEEDCMDCGCSDCEECL